MRGEAGAPLHLRPASMKRLTKPAGGLCPRARLQHSPCVITCTPKHRINHVATTMRCIMASDTRLVCPRSRASAYGLHAEALDGYSMYHAPDCSMARPQRRKGK